MMRRKAAAIILGIALTGGVIGAGAMSYADTAETTQTAAAGTSDLEGLDKVGESLAGSITNSANISQVSLETTSDKDTFSYSSVADVAESAMPSIVSITSKSVQEVQDYFFRGYGRTYQYESESAGSGIIVGSNDTELLIATNNHVVEDSSELTVTFIDESSIAAKVKGTDASNDLAIIAVSLDDISEDTRNQIKVANIGDSENIRVGEQVVAIGNALGYGQSVTTGIVSAKDRSISVSEDSQSYYDTEETVYSNLIQTDAAINPGNSGGALLDMNGNLIGINSAKASSNGVEGMGYAIPISKALPILENLMKRETRSVLSEDEMGYIGIRGQRVSADATEMYGIPSGIYVSEVTTGSPAESAGLKEGDIITAFDSQSVGSMQELSSLLQYYAAGESVDITVSSGDAGNYTEHTLTVVLGDRSALTSQQ